MRSTKKKKKKRTESMPESKIRFDGKCQQNVEGLEMYMHNYWTP